jgi:hypothetical protein
MWASVVQDLGFGWLRLFPIWAELGFGWLSWCTMWAQLRLSEGSACSRFRISLDKLVQDVGSAWISWDKLVFLGWFLISASWFTSSASWFTSSASAWPSWFTILA